jgi:hypothetical protein
MEGVNGLNPRHAISFYSQSSKVGVALGMKQNLSGLAVPTKTSTLFGYTWYDDRKIGLPSLL